MPEWTPKQARLIEKYADYDERQARDCVDPEAAVAASLLRVAFRFVATGNPTYKKICAELKLDVRTTGKGSTAIVQKNVQAMIDLARENGSEAATKLERARYLWRDLIKCGDDPFQRLRKARQYHLRY